MQFSGSSEGQLLCISGVSTACGGSLVSHEELIVS